MGKSTISMAMFNIYVKLPEGMCLTVDELSMLAGNGGLLILSSSGITPFFGLKGTVGGATCNFGWFI